MKKISLLILFLCTIKVQAQDVSKIKYVDTLVMIINQQTDLTLQYDSIFQNHPEVGLTLKTYLTLGMEHGALKKYINKVYSLSTLEGDAKEMVTVNTFYFDQNELIKVEELVTSGGKTKYLDWYYSDNKPLYYSLQYDKAEERANFLLTLAKTLLEQFNK